MAQRKETKKVKVRDMKPKKDAKGGGHFRPQGPGGGHQITGPHNQK